MTALARTAALYWANHPDKTWEECARDLGIHRNCYYNVWRHDPDWQKTVDAERRRIWKDATREATEKMMELMREGNFQAVKYVLDSNGYGATQKIEATVDTDININID